MVVHKDDEDLIILLPKENIILVGLKPSNVDNHEYTQEVGTEDLEVYVPLEKDKHSCQDQDPHHTYERLH